MFPAPDYETCVAYQGLYTGSWYVLTQSRHHGRYIYGGTKECAMTALTNAAKAARVRGWIN